MSAAVTTGITSNSREVVQTSPTVDVNVEVTAEGSGVSISAFTFSQAQHAPVGHTAWNLGHMGGVLTQELIVIFDVVPILTMATQ